MVGNYALDTVFFPNKQITGYPFYPDAAAPPPLWKKTIVALLYLRCFADHELSHCLESCNHGAQLDLLAGSRCKPMSEEMKHEQ